MKLTSSKNFGKTLKDKTDSEYRRLRDNFDNFLEQALHLGMFVPADEAGNVLEEPENYHLWSKYGDFTQYGKSLTSVCKPYKQAKERVLFEFEGDLSLIRNVTNFYIIEDKNGIYYRVLKNNTKTKIEDLLKFSVEITLTETAIKQIGL